MKYIKHKITGLTGVFLILIVVLSPWIVWHFKPDKKLEVAIFDKTVPQPDYREHKGLVWLLNNYKYVKADGENYSLLDYFGFFPEKDLKYKIKPLPKDLSNYDVIYVADTYGVYDRDFYGVTKNIEGERSNKIYGGTEINEVDTIEKSVNIPGKNKTLVVEFNSLASPTDNKTSGKFDKLLGLSWTGWVGREFPNLSKNNPEIPRWAFRNYEKQYHKKWNFNGPGYLFVKSDDTLFVLEKNKDLGKKDLTLRFTDEGNQVFNTKKDTGYYYWFDIVKTDNKTKSLASFNFQLTNSGKEKFNQFGIPDTFPAITVNKAENYTSYYFSGDFADKQDFPVFYQASGLPKINSVLISNYGNADSFFWKVYAPVMEKIFADAYNTKTEGIKQANNN